MGTLGGAPVTESANSDDEAAEPAGGGTGARRPWQPRTRPNADGSSQGSPLASFHGTPGWLFAQIRKILGFGVMRASAPLKNWTGEPIRARAWLESARIDERYRYSQEISLNADVREVSKPAGVIKLVLPYDGDKYFTRQAYQDAVRARQGGASPDDKAIIGFLALTGYEKTGLEGPLGLQANYGSVPVQVSFPAPPGPGETDQIFADGSACVVSEKYQPEAPKIVPVHIHIELDDPDTAESGDGAERGRPRVAGVLDAAARQEARAEMIERAPERQLDFEPDLWLRMTVLLHLPRTLAEGVDAKVSKVFISWPTHTSLRSLELHADGQTQLRYNPEQEHEGHRGGLEWSGVPVRPEDLEPVAEEDGMPPSSEDETITLSSGEMTLSISNPGELYKQEKLSGRVEVTVNRLLSGMDARLYDATGRQCLTRRTELNLKSTVAMEFSLPLYDAFARRTMWPYQWLYFDEVIPNEMRIDDIVMALRNRGFKVSSPPSGNPELCRIVADRTHGPDQLRLRLYITGERYKARRERSVPGGMTYRTSVDSGDFQIKVYGSLRGDSKPVVYEINALRRALRERFDRLPAGR
jgi:hypothetical protein